MKIDLFIKGLGLGGAERHVVDVALSLHQAGQDVRVIYILPNKSALCEELSQHGIDPICIGGRGKFAWLGYLPRYIRLTLAQRPDIVHSHLPVPGVVARLSKLVVGFRCVYTEHNMYGRLHPLTRLLHRATHWIDDRAISCSEQVADSLPWDSYVVINGVTDVCSPPPSRVAVRDQLGISGDALVFMSVANLLQKKNHALMIEAFAAYASTAAQESHLVLVGQDGTERASLEDLSRKASMEHRVHFYGPHPNARLLLPGADVFCLSSDFEGLPIALLESMVAGMPAIVTDAGGMADAVVNDATGFVIARGDAVAYERALHKMASSADVRERMGRSAAHRARDFYSQDAMVSKIVEHYTVAVG